MDLTAGEILVNLGAKGGRHLRRRPAENYTSAPLRHLVYLKPLRDQPGGNLM